MPLRHNVRTMRMTHRQAPQRIILTNTTKTAFFHSPVFQAAFLSSAAFFVVTAHDNHGATFHRSYNFCMTRNAGPMRRGQ